LNTLDLLILIPLAFGAYTGYRKGILVELVGVLAFVAATIVGFRFLSFGIDLLAPYISVEVARRVLPWLGFSLIFFPTIFLINRMGFAMRQAMRQTILGTLDRLLGAAVGLFTWLFGISVLFWLLSFMGVKLPAKHTDGAWLYPQILPVAHLVMDKTTGWRKTIVNERMRE
jgi:membrane protein required for colicin V production